MAKPMKWIANGFDAVGNDLTNADGPWADSGMPTLATSDVTRCGDRPGQRGCTRAGR